MRFDGYSRVGRRSGPLRPAWRTLNMKRHVAFEAAVFVALAGFCVTVRVTDHLANFAPVAAAALFGGFWFSRTKPPRPPAAPVRW